MTQANKGKRAKGAKKGIEGTETQAESGAEEGTAPVGKKRKREETTKPAKDKKKEPEKKMLNDEEARKEIAEYMERQNRPYSVQNIIDNLHGRVKKKQVEKITEGLVEEKVLTVKEYGKSKIFMINQDIFPKVD